MHVTHRILLSTRNRWKMSENTVLTKIFGPNRVRYVRKTEVL